MRAISRNDRPPNDYKRKFSISKHALDRFRERVDEEFRHRNDQDLGNLLDEKLRHSEHQYTVRDPRAPEEVTELFTIAMRRNGTFYAVVRHMTAVTVLDEDMARRNFAEAWTPTLNTPFNNKSLKKVMYEMQTAPPRVQLTSKDEAILRGDLPLPSETPLAPHGATYQPTALEAAGVKYAHTLKQCLECETALERANQAVVDAEAALQEARNQHEQARQELTSLAGTEK